MNQDALWLAREELKRSKFAIIFTALFFLIYGGITAIITGDIVMEEFKGEVPHSMKFAADIIFLSLMSVICFAFSKGYLGNAYWKTDFFTVRLSVLRTLPISAGTIVLQRLLQMSVYGVITAASFFTVFYLFSQWAQDTFTLSQYLLFVLCWTSYGFALGIFFVCMEWGVSGKKYLIGCSLVFVVLICLKAFLFFGIGEHITFWIAAAVTGPDGWMVTLLFVAIGIAAVLIGVKRLETIIRYRDFR